MKISLGISTCPNDTYIYESLIKGLKNSPFEWNVFFADVETLNQLIIQEKLDVAKVSAQIYPQVESKYECLSCGGAIGYGCGPLLLSSKGDTFDPKKITFLPGENTTAALLFKFWYKVKFCDNPHIDYALFNEVYKGLCSKKIEQGVTIHEHRFTWKTDNLFFLQDLGAFWEKETKSPIPLGIAVAHRKFSLEILKKIEQEIRESIRIARSRENLVTPFIREKSQIEDEKVIESHIKMFVNDFSEEISNEGKMALEYLWGKKRLISC